MKNSTKKIVFIGFFTAGFVLRALNVFQLSFSWVFFKSFFSQLCAWLAGGFLGAYFIKIEQIFYSFYIKPQEALSQEIQALFKQRKKKELWRLLKKGVNQQKLAFRSAVFQIVWVVLAFFTVSSTVGMFGKGLVMAIGLHLLLDEWNDYLNDKDIGWLFWQIKRPVGPQEQKRFLWLMTGLFGLVSILII